MKYEKMKYLFLAVLALGLGMLVEPAFAGTDTVFGSATVAGSGPVYTLTLWLKGSLGILISLIALTVALISAIGGRLMGVAMAVGTAIAVQVGPSVLSGMFTATLPFAA